MLLTAENVSLNFGTKQLLEDVSLYVNAGDKYGIIGINGTGKSTLLRVLAGRLAPDSGSVATDPNVRLSFLGQNPEMDPERTVMEQVMADHDPQARELAAHEARAMLYRLGIADTAQRVGTLSGGQRKRVALAAVLLSEADVLILDEPTNHLDSEMAQWLEQYLRHFSGGVVMVTHDRYFLENAANHITELDRGKLYHSEANYSRYLELKAQRAEYAEAAERRRQSILRVEYQWIMRGAQARRTKNKDRIARYEALKEQAAPETDETVRMAAASSRLGRKTIALEHVSKAFGEKQVIADFTYSVGREDRIGIIGPNGAGKSTLLNLMAGRLAPDSGGVETGATVKLGYFTQEGRELDLTQRVYDFIHETASTVVTREGALSAAQMMERFLFPTQLQAQPIGSLSGGERRRLYLLSILMTAPNILLLDEPTNDLDVTTLAILEDYLEDFPGAVLAVSHDRWFLDKLAEEIFEVCPGGEVRRSAGNWSDWQRRRREEQVRTAPAPEKKPAPAKVAEPKPQRLKFSYREQREYDTIEADIAALEEQRAALERDMEANASDYVRLQELLARQETLDAQLEEKMERWLYLSDLAERIAAQKGS